MAILTIESHVKKSVAASKLFQADKNDVKRRKYAQVLFVAIVGCRLIILTHLWWLVRGSDGAHVYACVRCLGSL